VVALVDRALAFEKGHRWPSAAAMRDAVKDAMVGVLGRVVGRESLPTLFAPEEEGKARTRRLEAEARRFEVALTPGAVPVTPGAAPTPPGVILRTMEAPSTKPGIGVASGSVAGASTSRPVSTGAGVPGVPVPGSWLRSTAALATFVLVGTALVCGGGAAAYELLLRPAADRPAGPPAPSAPPSVVTTPGGGATPSAMPSVVTAIGAPAILEPAASLAPLDPVTPDAGRAVAPGIPRPSSRPLSAPPPSAPPGPLAPPTAPATPPPAHPAAGEVDSVCSTPFYLDDQGEKHFKPQCFGAK
jgi:hypothetical protein